MLETICNRCGLLVDLENLHPNSLPLDIVPDDEDAWYAVHGDGDQCADDRRAWIVILLDYFR